MTSTFWLLFGLADEAPESGDEAVDDDDDVDIVGDVLGVDAEAKEAFIPMALSLFSLLTIANSSSRSRRPSPSLG